MTDQAMLTEMARLLAIIERYWSTHFSVEDEIGASTVQRVRAVLVEYRQKLLTPWIGLMMGIVNSAGTAVLFNTHVA